MPVRMPPVAPGGITEHSEACRETAPGLGLVRWAQTGYVSDGG